MLPYALIFGGWVLAVVLAVVLGPRTDFSVGALLFVLCIGNGCIVAAVVIS